MCGNASRRSSTTLRGQDIGEIGDASPVSAGASIARDELGLNRVAVDVKQHRDGVGDLHDAENHPRLDHDQRDVRLHELLRQLMRIVEGSVALLDDEVSSFDPAAIRQSRAQTLQRNRAIRGPAFHCECRATRSALFASDPVRTLPMG
jgi:hypothetical protein